MKNIAERVNSLRKNMLKNNFDACIIPSSDPHASEYVPSHWKAREYFSGFTGSAGTLVVTTELAGLWTDSRYLLQAEKELENTNISLFKEGEANTPKITDWLCQILRKRETVSIYKELFSINEIKNFHIAFSYNEIEINTETDLISMSWTDRPVISETPVFIHEEKFAGEDVANKLMRIRQEMDLRQADILVLNALDEIAWTFNIRGNDIKYNPVAIAYAAIEKNCAHLFINTKKVAKSISDQLNKLNIKLHEYSEIGEYLKHLSNKKIWMNPAKTNFALYEYSSDKNEILTDISPVLDFKSIKNKTEITGIKHAMIKDGVALTQFFIWFEHCRKENIELSELLIGEKLKEYRAKQELFFGESFAPIVGHKEHGAIVHYSATEESNSIISQESFLLIDSGAQFLHGTTDITRTVSLGKLTKQEQKDFTLVLKGHIALAQAEFPEGTCGYQLDSLARQYLWKEGLNYGHGTGHGVGCFLSVHEGPQGIRPDTNKTVLKEGMIISNEPGVYRTNEYGIRIENLIMVCKCKKNEKQNFYYFETLTLFPLDKNSINQALLTQEEKNWLNNYHQKVYENLSPNLNVEEQKWLAEKCQAI